MNFYQELQLNQAGSKSYIASFKNPKDKSTHTFNAITMFYKQIILRRGLPFDVKMPANILLDASTLSAEQMDAELQKGYDDMQNGRTKSVQATFADIRKDYPSKTKAL